MSKHDRDERLALPLDPEVALKALLAVDPDPDPDADDSPEDPPAE